MKEERTNRGFAIVSFDDRYDKGCTLQKSSLATEDAIWLGVHEAKAEVNRGTGWKPYPLPDDVFIATRMHLTQEMVKELLPYLHRFVETGEIFEEEG